ncbi:MAG: 5'-nucleotidase [Mariniphaga sp.]|nr:5'-nucleotidase [Mariniphaga sp.]MDD4227250.1 5'-nucleotidase [Mariniphaga sp.]MDD4425664.1 5'-nucleotidase [Mariniphaga sp.]
MQRSITYALLITSFFLFYSCRNQYAKNTVESRNQIVSDSFMPVDSQLVLSYLPYKQILEKDMLRVISVCAEEMVKDKPESGLTNFLADLLLIEGEKLLKISGKDFKPDISYFNYGGIRTFLPRGEITVGKIFELMPFENEIVFLQISGHQVKEFLDQIARGGGDSVGGVRFKISGNKATQIWVGRKPINLDAKYWLVTNDYIASGGDGDGVLSKRTGYFSPERKIRDVIISHLEYLYERGEVIAVKTDGRISY